MAKTQDREAYLGKAGRWGGGGGKVHSSSLRPLNPGGASRLDMIAINRQLQPHPAIQGPG